MAHENPALARHVPRVFPELEQLFEAGEHVEALAVHPGWEAVQAVLKAEIDATSALMDRSVAPLEQADYAMRHGRVGGLKAAQEALDAIAEASKRRLHQQQTQHEAAAEPVAGR